MAKKQSTSRPAGNKYKLIGLRLVDDVREQVEEMATGERRPVAQMCAILVEEALAARQQKQSK